MPVGHVHFLFGKTSIQFFLFLKRLFVFMMYVAPLFLYNFYINQGSPEKQTTYTHTHIYTHIYLYNIYIFFLQNMCVFRNWLKKKKKKRKNRLSQLWRMRSPMRHSKICSWQAGDSGELMM